MGKRLMRFPAMMAAWLPAVALADPLDRGEAYTERGAPPDWMDGVDFGWLLVDYGVFAIVVVAFGWVLLRRPQWFEQFEALLSAPFGMLFRAASGLPVLLRELAQGLIGLVILGLVVGWVFFCQWLSHHHLGAIAMAGLALLAVILVRLVKRSESREAA